MASCPRFRECEGFEFVADDEEGAGAEEDEDEEEDGTGAGGDMQRELCGEGESSLLGL